MSVWIDLLVAPRRPCLLGRNQFRNLAADLIDQALVTMTCAILGGAISVEYPLAVANVAAACSREKPADLDLYYKGDDRVSLIKTLAEVPYGQSDLCIWFEGFNWQNPSLAESFGRQGYANADLLLYALAQPRPLRCFDCFAGTCGEEHMIQVCLRTAGNRGPWDIAGTPLSPLLARYFELMSWLIAPTPNAPSSIATFARAEFDATCWVNPNSYVTSFLLLYFK